MENEIEIKKELLDKISKIYNPSSEKTDFDFWYSYFDLETVKKFIVGEKIIELGCGKGIITLELAKIAKKVIVIEGSKNNINYVKNIAKERNVNNIEFVYSLWEKFQYNSSDISDILLISGPQYLEPERFLELLRKAKLWLKQNGRFHIIAPNAYSMHRRIARYMNIIKDVHDLSDRDKKLGHKKVYDREELFDICTKAGYKIFHWEGIFLKPFQNDILKNLNKAIIRALYEIGKELPDYCAHIYICLTK